MAAGLDGWRRPTMRVHGKSPEHARSDSHRPTYAEADVHHVEKLTAIHAPRAVHAHVRRNLHRSRELNARIALSGRRRKHNAVSPRFVMDVSRRHPPQQRDSGHAAVQEGRLPPRRTVRPPNYTGRDRKLLASLPHKRIRERCHPCASTSTHTHRRAHGCGRPRPRDARTRPDARGPRRHFHQITHQAFYGDACRASRPRLRLFRHRRPLGRRERPHRCDARRRGIRRQTRAGQPRVSCGVRIRRGGGERESHRDGGGRRRYDPGGATDVTRTGLFTLMDR